VPFPTKAIKKLKTTMKNCSEGIKKMAQNEVIITSNGLTHQIYTSLNRHFNFTQGNTIPSIQFYSNPQYTINSISHKPTSYRQFNFKQADKIPSNQFHTSQQDTVNSILHKSARYNKFNITQADKLASIQF
jgi:hypothetical protein